MGNRRGEKIPLGGNGEKGLPVNVDAERFVLGSIILDDKFLPQVSARLQPDSFSLEKHRRIFTRMLDLQERGSSVDRITIANELRRNGELESVDGLSYLMTLDEGLPQLPNIDEYVAMVKEAADQRQLIFIAQNVMNRAMDARESAGQIIGDVRDSLFGLTVDDSTKGAQSFGQYIETLERGISQFLEPRKPGIQTGFRKFDEMTGGLRPGELFILAARPSVGKSAMALDMARYISIVSKQQVPTAVFSLEMTKEALFRRIQCALGRVDSQRARMNYLNSDERHRLANAAQLMSESPFYVDDNHFDLMSIMSEIYKLKSRHGIGLAIIDYLQLMKAMSKRLAFENRNQEVSFMSRQLKLLAHDLGIPIIALSQLSRAPELRKGKARPILSDLRESGSIEQDADIVAFIFREEMYDRDRADLRGLAELILAKQREGPVGTINLVFLHNLTRFDNRAEDSPEVDEEPPPIR